MMKFRLQSLSLGFTALFITALILQWSVLPKFEDSHSPKSTQKVQMEGNHVIPSINSGILNSELTADECFQTVNRNYTINPLEVGTFEGAKECEIGCFGGASKDGVRGNYGESPLCPYTKTIFKTMENLEASFSDYDIIANTKLNSHAPMIYFGWKEFQFMRPPEEKKLDVPLMSMISNCAPQKRLDWLKRMRDVGLKIDSYGGCDSNKDFSEAQRKRGFLTNKINLSAKYKFCYAAENSETDDYLSEKLFGCLMAGSVPVFMGAANVKKFVPSDYSIIETKDFETPEELGKYLLYLDSNDTAYQEYLSWKYEGPTQEFISLMDLGLSNSDCRTCIAIADQHRRDIGNTPGHNVLLKKEPKIGLYIRERGKFWLSTIYLNELTIDVLYEKISANFPVTKGKIWKVYYLWDLDKVPFNYDIDVEQLKHGQELEVIFEDPDNPNRYSYTTWKQQQNLT